MRRTVHLRPRWARAVRRAGPGRTLRRGARVPAERGLRTSGGRLPRAGVAGLLPDAAALRWAVAEREPSGGHLAAGPNSRRFTPNRPQDFSKNRVVSHA